MEIDTIYMDCGSWIFFLLNEELFNFNEAKFNFIEGKEMDQLVTELVDCYSHQGATILDVTGMNGKNYHIV